MVLVIVVAVVAVVIVTVLALVVVVVVKRGGEDILHMELHYYTSCCIPISRPQSIILILFQ